MESGESLSFGNKGSPHSKSMMTARESAERYEEVFISTSCILAVDLSPHVHICSR